MFLKLFVRACNFLKKNLESTFFTEHFRWLLLKLLFFFYVKIYLRVKNWLIRLLINQVLFSFKMKKHGSFAEMNMILITIPKAQLLSFLALIYWNILLLLKHFLLLLKPSDYGDNQQLVFISIYKCSNSLWALISALIASGLFLAFAYLRIFSSYFVVFFYRTHMQYSLNIVLPWI